MLSETSHIFVLGQRVEITIPAALGTEESKRMLFICFSARSSNLQPEM